MANHTRTWPTRRIFATMAALVAVTLAISSPYAPSASAGTSAASITTYSGQATFYQASAGTTTNGNCSFAQLPASKYYVALGPKEYAAGARCGSYLWVTGPKGSVRVVVMDQCPECGPNHLDLSKQAFARIADVKDGLVPITWRTVKDPTVPAMSFRFKDGSSQWWFALQVFDHGNQLRSLEVKVNGTWKKASRVDYGYWIYQPGAGPGPYQVRITDVFSHQVTVSNIKMQPMVVQTTTARLYPAK